VEQEWAVLGAGVEWACDEKFFMRITECLTQIIGTNCKTDENNQLKNRKTCGCTKVVCQHCAYASRPPAIITL